jgi:hypothetical protein
VFFDTTNEVETWHIIAHTDFSGNAEEGHCEHPPTLLDVAHV